MRPKEPTLHIFLPENPAVKTLSRAEYDRLLAVEGEYRRLRATSKDLLEALEDLVDACDGNYRELTDLARAAIARAKGGE